MNILILHGLESKLSDEKRTILETYGTVFAPYLDYESNPNVIQNLYDKYHNQEFSAVIGSSMGGFTAYHLANSLGCLCSIVQSSLAL